MKKKIYNRFINWWYKEDLVDAKAKIERLPISKAIFFLGELKNNIHPKTDAIKKLDKILNDRINPPISKMKF